VNIDENSGRGLVQKTGSCQLGVFSTIKNQRFDKEQSPVGNKWTKAGVGRKILYSPK